MGTYWVRTSNGAVLVERGFRREKHPCQLAASLCTLAREAMRTLLAPTQIEAKVQVMAYLIQLECMCFFWLSGRPTLLPTYSWTGNGVTRPRTPMALALVLAITALRGTYLNRIYASCTMRARFQKLACLVYS